MKLDFCAACGSKEDLHQHHIVPVIISGTDRKDTNDDDTITLCSYHHNMIHGIKKSKQYHHSNLIQEGLKKARNNGVTLGRPTTLTDSKIEEIVRRKNHGEGVRSICKDMKIGPYTYYNALERYVEYEKKKLEKTNLLIRAVEKNFESSRKAPENKKWE